MCSTPWSPTRRTGGNDEGAVTAIIAPGVGHDVTMMTKQDIKDAAVRQPRPMLDAAS